MAEPALVIFGTWLTVRVKAWVAVPVPLMALMVIGKLPPLVPVGVPEMVAVPLPLLTKVTPAGRAPDSPNEGAG